MSCDASHCYVPAGVSLWLLLAMGAASLSAQQTQDLQMRIVLEQQIGSTVRSVNPQHVFETGDLVRFRVRSSSAGFLYVSNRAASGKYSELFPGRGPATDNRIESGRDYRIPAARRSWFRIEQPPGYETVFFTFTYAPLARRSESALAPAADGLPVGSAPPPELIPRCDDSLFRARGECLDVDAGPGAIPPGAAAKSDAITPRDLAIVQNPDATLVSPASPGDAPIVYEFRIAHR